MRNRDDMRLQEGAAASGRKTHGVHDERQPCQEVSPWRADHTAPDSSQTVPETRPKGYSVAVGGGIVRCIPLTALVLSVGTRAFCREQQPRRPAGTVVP
jgi:hypothetical protein